jgi:Domain of unknown function (DUF4190)
LDEPVDEASAEVVNEVAEPARKTNGKAIGSLALGLIGMTGVLFVAAVVAIVLGRRAHAEIEVTRQKGSALASVGIVLGWLGLVVAVSLVVLFIVTTSGGN